MYSINKILPALVATGFGVLLFSCTTSTEEWNEPTTGVITTVREVAPDDFKIVSEDPVPSVADSRIIINPLQGPSDTLTLDEAKAIAATGDTTSTGQGRENRAVRRAGMGFFGYMMLGRMMGGVNRGAYVNNNAYNRATSGTGSRMRNSARRVGGSSRNTGFGGRSSRSVGG